MGCCEQVAAFTIDVQRRHPLLSWSSVSAAAKAVANFCFGVFAVTYISDTLWQFSRAPPVGAGSCHGRSTASGNAHAHRPFRLSSLLAFAASVQSVRFHAVHAARAKMLTLPPPLPACVNIMSSCVAMCRHGTFQLRQAITSAWLGR